MRFFSYSKLILAGFVVWAALAAFTGCTTVRETEDGTGGSGTGGGGGGTPDHCLDLLGAELAPGTAPQERGDMAAAYDPVCKRVYMFFGDSAIPEMCNPSASAFMSDGYVYDVEAGIWTSIDVAPGAAPLPRARGRAIWDEVGSRFIVFGGRHRDGTDGPYTFLNDVWAFDPITRAWTELSAHGAGGAPLGRMNHTMDADPANNRFIVHAGGQTDFTAFTVDNQTWTFDLATNTFAQIGQTSPPPGRLFHMSTLDRAGNRLIIFSGGDVNAFVGPFLIDTWSLDLTSDTWSQLSSSAVPPSRIKGEMVFDSENNRAILFAGHDATDMGNTNDLWTLDMATSQWAVVTWGDTLNEPAKAFCDFPANFTFYDEGSPERRESHLFQNGDRKAIMYGGRTDCGLAKDTWELDYATLTWTMKNDSPVGITCLRTGSPTCVTNNNMCL
jgi:N-acetylneuraminic acid mutarotase